MRGVACHPPGRPALNAPSATHPGPTSNRHPSHSTPRQPVQPLNRPILPVRRIPPACRLQAIFRLSLGRLIQPIPRRSLLRQPPNPCPANGFPTPILPSLFHTAPGRPAQHAAPPQISIHNAHPIHRHPDKAAIKRSEKTREAKQPKGWGTRIVHWPGRGIDLIPLRKAGQENSSSSGPRLARYGGLACGGCGGSGGLTGGQGHNFFS